MDRNSINRDGFVIAPVKDFDIFSGASFFVGDEDIDDFINNDAQRHHARKMAVTYSLQLDGDNSIFAFFSLQNDSIKISDYDDFPYKTFPAVKIGRIDVAKAYQGQGIGSMLLDMVAELMCTENRTGCRFVTLDAYNKQNVIAFYEKNGFQRLLPEEKTKGRRTIPMYKDLL